MKKTSLIFALLFLLLLSGKLISQPLTQGGIFDKLKDRFGNDYALSDLSLSATKPIGGTASVNAVPTQSCSAGYFNLYFAPGTIFSSNSQAQTVLCEVFSNISGFINSPLSPVPNVGTKINIYCSNTPTTSPGTLGTASSMYIFPANPSSPNPGIADNAIYKAIISGIDPFAQLPVAFFPWANNYYHGYVNISPTAPWNFSTSTTTMSATDYDYYTICLHEVCHALGFASLIDGNGLSKFGASNNYYARYDLFLKDPAGVPLLASNVASCSPMSGLAFQGSTLALASGTCPGTPGITTCSSAVQYSSTNVNNVKVYTPGCFSAGSSLSHFEDMCSFGSFTTTCIPTPTAPGYNNLYYVMSEGQSSGTCYIKRYLKNEERFVFCDLGYSVNTTYTSNAAGATHSYGGSACSPTNIIGINDGLVNGAYVYTTTIASLSISLASILSNDLPASGLSVSCYEAVYNNATLSVSGTSLVVTSTLGAGFVLLKYLPKNTLTNQFGNPTYIYTYFLPGSCSPPNPCNMVQNGSFESVASGTPYGLIDQLSNPGGPVLSCWTNNVSPDLYYRYSAAPIFSLNNNAAFPVPNIDSHNGSPNDKIVGFWNGGELMKNYLSSPLVPGQPYQISLHAYNISNPTNSINANSAPIVINVASGPSFAAPFIPNFPTGLTVLASFTVNMCNVWTPLTQTFVFSPTLSVNHNMIIVGANGSFMNPAVTYWSFMDDISLMPVSNSPFIIPNASNCGNTTFTNLAQYAPPIPGVFSGAGVSAITTTSGTVYNFNSPPTLTAGTYPIAFTNTSVTGCVNTMWQNVVIAPASSLTVSGNNNYCLGSSIGASVNAGCPTCPSGAVYFWQPSNLSGSAQVLTPSVSTVYTVSANNGSCMATQTLAVNVVTNCCISNASVFALTSVTQGAVYNGPLVILNSFTIQPNQVVVFGGGEYVFDPNVKITVSNGAQLLLKDAHLYSCTNTMWQGIEVLDGGFVSSLRENVDNLIEDAITAIDVSNSFTSNVTPILNIANTTFNKNYISINISNYQRSLSTFSNAFSISSCVFTSRNLPFNSLSWPQTGITSAVNTSSADLRYVNTSFTPTTGLAPPYLNQGFSIVNLKNPYSNQNSHIAIKISSVVVNTSQGIVIGNPSSTTFFNLFDYHGRFISADNSNVTSLNNVFQNTRTYTVSGGSDFGGSAVYHAASAFVNVALTLTATSTNVGNRFWDCHRGVEGNNTYLFWIENSIFRSTQNSNNYTSTSFSVGNTGLYMKTNRFDYYVANNEFTNLQTGIHVPIVAGVFTIVPTCSLCPTILNGVYANKLRISQNRFSEGSSGNAYMDNAVKVAGLNTVPWYVPNINVSPFTQAVAVNNNSLTNVFRGISVSNIAGFQSQVSNNNITLKIDNAINAGVSQHAVDLLNTTPTSSATIGKNIISSNTASYSASTATLNTNTSLIFCGNNSYGIASPSVACNNLSNAYQGFVFDSPNSGALWAGNIMTLPIARGFMLSNAGFIGTQGGTSTAISNIWAGGTWTVTNGHYGTYVGNNSVAQNSLLWVKNGSSYPPSNFGSVAINLWFGAPNTLSVSPGGDYNCSGIPNNKVVKLPNGNDYSSADQLYIARMALYRFLHFNDSVRTANATMGSFYTTHSTSSIGKFVQVEQKFYQGDISGAVSLNGSITTTNTVESNYKSYYSKYANYASNGFNSINSVVDGELFSLANSCPGANGGCIYQARDLYNLITKRITNYYDCVSATGSRMANISEENNTSPEISKKVWDVELFPNPATNQVTVVSKNEKEMLTIEIRDLSNRVVLTKLLETNDFIANLDLNLINGVYFITISNTNNEKITKKLLIEK